MKTLVVGEAPSKVMREGDPPLLLARHELAQLAGLGLASFLERFELMNVLSSWPGRSSAGKGDAFPMFEARRRGTEIISNLKVGRRVILLGRRVEEAFGLKEERWFTWRVLSEGKHLVVTAPHPSHVSRWWNDAENRIRARDFWRAEAELIAAQVTA